MTHCKNVKCITKLIQFNPMKIDEVEENIWPSYNE